LRWAVLGACVRIVTDPRALDLAGAKIGRRFRLFFRYDFRTKLIVFARVDDARNLRSVGSRSDPR